jgi:hypothetical protein
MSSISLGTYDLWSVRGTDPRQGGARRTFTREGPAEFLQHRQKSPGGAEP